MISIKKIRSRRSTFSGICKKSHKKLWVPKSDTCLRKMFLTKKMCIVCARRWNYFRCENKCDWDFFLFVSAASLCLAYVVFIIIIIHFHFHYLIKIPVSWLKKECVCVCAPSSLISSPYISMLPKTYIWSYMNLSMSVKHEQIEVLLLF